MCILAVSWLAGILLAGRQTVIGTNVVLVLYFILIILGLFVLKKYPQVLNSHVQSEWYPQLTLLLLLIHAFFLQAFGVRTAIRQNRQNRSYCGNSFLKKERLM